MMFRFGREKRKSKSWEEIREEIIQAIEEEKRAREPIISGSSTAEFPPNEVSEGATGSTASEDSYPLEE